MCKRIILFYVIKIIVFSSVLIFNACYFAGDTANYNKPTSCGNPAWSPDGLKTAFVLRINSFGPPDMGSSGSLCTINNDRTGLTNFANTAGISDFRWSSDGSKILLLSHNISSNYYNNDFYVINAGGDGKTYIGSGNYPSWSPYGSKIVFITMNYYYNNICIINNNGTGYTNLTNNTSEEISFQSAVWSSDNLKIYYIVYDHSVYGDEKIYIMSMDAAGTNPTSLYVLDKNNFTEINGQENYSWSTDKSKIALVSDYDYLYIIKLGTIVEFNKIAGDNYHLCHSPVWSPEGSKIAFVLKHDNIDDNTYHNSDICIINTDGSGLTNLENKAGSEWWDTQPSWSPDGSRIAFTSNRAKLNNIYLINTDGSGLVNLTYDPTSTHFWK